MSSAFSTVVQKIIFKNNKYVLPNGVEFRPAGKLDALNGIFDSTVFRIIILKNNKYVLPNGVEFRPAGN